MEVKTKKKMSEFRREKKKLWVRNAVTILDHS